MIVVDLNNIANACVYASKSGQDPEFLRHSILNSLRAINSKFGYHYGEMVVALDKKSWRYKPFPEYKARRKIKKKKETIDWTSLYEVIHEVFYSIRDNFYWKTICVEGCEVDDIMGVLARMPNREKILLVTSDKDMKQLLRYSDVEIYDNVNNKYAELDDPKDFLLELIMTGDSGDDIPNILSDNDVFINDDKKQRRLIKKYKDHIREADSIQEGIETLEVNITVDGTKIKLDNEEVLNNFKRNKLLIDLSHTPQNLAKLVVQQYNTPSEGSESKMRMYFGNHGLNELRDKINDFWGYEINAS